MIVHRPTTPHHDDLIAIRYARDIAKLKYREIGEFYGVSVQRASSWYTTARILLRGVPYAGG